MKLTGTQLKFLAVSFMTVEHIFSFLSPLFPPELVIATKFLGRLVAPTFVFLAVEGYIHTRNKERYIARLATAGIVMYLGSYFLSFITHSFLESNMFAAIACGLMTLHVFKYGMRTTHIGQKALSFLVAFLLLGVSFVLEGSFLLPLLLFLFYAVKDRNLVLIIYILLSLSFLYLQIFGIENIFPSVQWGMILFVPLYLLYNNQRGQEIKYFFYFYYPVHLWMLSLLSTLLLR